MENNGAKIKHKCPLCKYDTFRKFDLKRHQNSKHPVYELPQINVVPNSLNVVPILQNVVPKLQNVVPKLQNVVPKLQNVAPELNNGFLCIKCNKSYKVKKNLIAHESKCKGIDSLTCPKCMKSFSTRKTKSRHIKRDTCKARSIVHARVPNIQNITNNITNNTNIDNSITNNNTNNIIINNFGSERIDYLTFDNLQEIFRKGINNSIPSLIKEKHFNPNFPENNTIKPNKKNNTKCFIRKDNNWLLSTMSIICDKIIKENSYLLLGFSEKHKEELGQIILNEEIYDFINNKLRDLILKTDKDHYKTVKDNVKDIINSSES